MCGIVGALGFLPSQRSREIALERLRPRGPDGTGSLLADPGEDPFWLGFTRLAILDPTPRADQPMLDASQRYALVYNGEIYNFLELRNELEKSGCHFRTESDTEVLLQGLIAKGPNFLSSCNGMWAFCFYDRLERKAILGRDRFGKKPLFWTALGNNVVFASEMKALTPFMASVMPASNVDSMIADLFDYESSTECVIQNVNRIPPGHYGTWHLGRLRLTRWWCTLDHLVSVPNTYEKQVDTFRDLFFEAVALRMRSDVKVGTALSGGLDSSSVLATMSQIASGPSTTKRTAKDWQNAYCSSFPGSTNDETEWASRVAASLHVPLRKIVTTADSAYWSLEKSLKQMEDPYLTPPIPFLETYRDVAESGVKVTIDGHGADELFSGYGHLAAALNFADPGISREVLLIERGLSGLTEELDPQAYREFFRSAGVAFAKKMKWSVFERPNFPDANHPAFRQLSPLSKKLYELFHVTILPTLLRNYDRYSMANGVEIRMPFMDHRLVTYVFSLPDSAKFGDGFSKRILRDAMKGVLDERVRTRKHKVGWNAPVQDWLRGALLADTQRLAERGGISAKGRQELAAFTKEKKPTYKQGERLYRELLPAIWRAAMFGP